MTFVKLQESVELPRSTEVVETPELPRDVATVRGSEAESEAVANSIGSLLQRVAGSSVQEIDQLIAELHDMRKFLQNEAARVQREIIEYAHLSQSAMLTTKVISENLARRKADAEAPKLGDDDEALRPGPGAQEPCRTFTGLRPDGGAAGAASLVRQDEQAQTTGLPSRAKRIATR
jgi:hypothetical protein